MWIMCLHHKLNWDGGQLNESMNGTAFGAGLIELEGIRWWRFGSVWDGFHEDLKGFYVIWTIQSLGTFLTKKLTCLILSDIGEIIIT